MNEWIVCVKYFTTSFRTRLYLQAIYLILSRYTLTFSKIHVFCKVVGIRITSLLLGLLFLRNIILLLFLVLLKRNMLIYLGLHVNSLLYNSQASCDKILGKTTFPRFPFLRDLRFRISQKLPILLS
jgi:hypothetical protein